MSFVIVKSKRELNDSLVELESELNWYQRQFDKILTDLATESARLTVALEAIDTQGRKIIQLEEQAREYRSVIRKYDKQLEEVKLNGSISMWNLWTDFWGAFWGF